MLKTLELPILLALVCFSASSATHAAENTPAPEKKTTSTKIIPLPIYATLPQEGDTFGFMPVFMVVEEPMQRTQSIFAPSYSWNKNIGHTATFRWFHYPNEHTRLHLIPSISSIVNRGMTVEYEKGRKEKGTWTVDAGLEFYRSVFHRFFGLGSHTDQGDETSFTRLYGQFDFRAGYYFSKELNFGFLLAGRRILTENIGVSGFPVTHSKFPGQPGLNPSTVLGEGFSVRYDSRPQKEYSTAGRYIDASARYFEGLSGSPAFLTTSFETKSAWREVDEALTGAARFYWNYVAGTGQVPFHYLSALGGAYRLRGFTENRFSDKGAWTLEIEQRIAMFQTNIYDVLADWRVDPFIAIGQVYHGLHDVFDHLQVSGGLGFRAWVRPNVLGRVDTAIGGEGLKVYVELGYPF